MANVVIWTLTVWAALIVALLQDDRLVWQWLLNGAVPAQAAPIEAPPSEALEKWLAPEPRATAQPTPTATRVVAVPDLLPEMPDAPSVAIAAEVEPASVEAQTAAINLPAVEQTVDEEGSSSEPVVAAPAASAADDAATAVVTEWPPPAAPPLPLTADIEANMPTRLEITAVEIDSAVEPVAWETVERDGQLTSAWEVAEHNVGWHQNSALPGQPGNTVLAAHSNIGGQVFRHLSNIEKGDKITVYVGYKAFNYTVDITTIVKEAGEPLSVRRQNARWIAPTDDERLTLVTCWPYPYSTHRFIVVAKPL